MRKLIKEWRYPTPHTLSIVYDEDFTTDEQAKEILTEQHNKIELNAAKKFNKAFT